MQGGGRGEPASLCSQLSPRYEHTARRLRAKPRQTTQRTRPGARAGALPGAKIPEGVMDGTSAPAGARRGARCAFPLRYEHAGRGLSAKTSANNEERAG